MSTPVEPIVMLRFSEWVDFVNGFTGERPKDLRLGQWAFNLLHELNSGIANVISGTDADPFYRDDVVPVFLCRLLTEFVTMDDPAT
jgi:hypothetical protein